MMRYIERYSANYDRKTMKVRGDVKTIGVPYGGAHKPGGRGPDLTFWSKNYCLKNTQKLSRKIPQTKSLV